MGGPAKNSAEGFDPYHKWLGIPPEQRPIHHYRLLGLSLFESDADVIANAADQRMGHVRSFQTGRHAQASQRLLNEIAAARICLLNPAKKAHYDQRLREELARGAMGSGDSVAGAAGQEKGWDWQRLRNYPAAQRWLLLGGAAACLALAALLLVRRPWQPAPEPTAGGKEPSSWEATETATPLEGDGGGARPGVSHVVATMAARPAVAGKPETARKPDGLIANTTDQAIDVAPLAAKPSAGETPRFPSSSPPSLPPETSEPPLPEEKPRPTSPTDPPAQGAQGDKAAPPRPKEATGDEAVSQLKASLGQARSPAEFRAVAQAALQQADRAAGAGRPDLGVRLVTEVLVAARKADDSELVARVTLRLLDLRQQAAQRPGAAR